jgi:hypothetical protein
MRKWVGHKKLKIHNDIAGPLFGTLGAVYAVLLAFVVVITWENFDRSNLNVEKESNCAADLFADAESFPAQMKLQVRELLQKYTSLVISDEWKMLARGEASPRVDEIVKSLRLLYCRFSPATITEQIFFRESVHKFNELCELRSLRILDSRTGIHPLLWFVLASAGIVTIAFSFFFGCENTGSQMAMTVLLAVVISLILFTILELDFPFSGSVSIHPEAFMRIHKSF